MADKWFSNRGQIVQILIAFTALVVGILVAFPTLPVQQGIQGFVTVWPIIIFPLVALGIMWLNNNRINRTLEKLGAHVTSIPVVAEPSVAPAMQSSVTTPVVAEPLRSFSVTRSEPRWENDEMYVIDAKIKVGSYWDEPNAREKIRISVLSLKGDAPGRQSVELGFKYGGIVFHGGSETIQVSVNRFIVPPSSSGFQSEERCVHEFSFSEEHLQFLVIRLDAIDTHANEVVLNIAKVRMAKRTRL
jgi:hypothetical protein